MISADVKRMAMHGLRSCEGGTVQRNKVTTAMRNTDPETRKEAVQYLLTNGYVTTSTSPNKGRGRSPLMVTITNKGKEHLNQLEASYSAIHNTIWG